MENEYSNKIKIASVTFLILGCIFIAVPTIDYILKANETNNYISTKCKIIKLKRKKSGKGAEIIVLSYEYYIDGITYKIIILVMVLGELKITKKFIQSRNIS